MNTLDLLQKAINEKRSISFEYEKEGHPIGERIGNPHAIFIHSNNTNNISIHIYQTDGVSSSMENKSDWRTFIVEEVKNVKLLNSSFTPNRGYNPYSKMYNRVICKL